MPNPPASAPHIALGAPHAAQSGLNAPQPALPVLAYAVVGLLCLLTWALSHVYLGLFHDAGLYTLQALARLKPDQLSQDVFLKFGSQDRFTLFGPLYAEAASLLGVEYAAAILTLVFQLALIVGAWALARSVLPTSLALLGTATLIAIPGYYGTEGVFTCLEPFLTPRMAGEALVLGAVAATLSGRKMSGLLLIAAAALLHPIMAIAGVAALTYLAVSAVRSERRLWGLLLIAALVGLVTLGSSALPIGGHWGRFDPEWLALLKGRSPYLFMVHWHLEDWSRALITLTTLLLGLIAPPSPRAAVLARAAFVILLSGVALTLIGCDLLHSVLLTQLQPWRCQWFATVAAALLLPAIFGELWRKDTAQRTAALALLAAWVFASDFYALVAICACLASLVVLSKLKPSEARWLLLGSAGLLTVALLWRLASNLEFTDAYSMDPRLPLWLRRATSLVRDGSVPMALIVGVYGLARSRYALPSLLVLGVLTLAACAALLPSTWDRWTHRDYPPSLVERFSALRAQLAPNADVFWPQSPVGAWMLLEHPSYLSVIQTSGMVFSRDSAVELERRADALKSVMGPATFMDWNNGGGTGLELAKSQQIAACGTGAFEYLVTTADLGLELLASVPSPTGSANKRIRLYRCPPSAS